MTHQRKWTGTLSPLSAAYSLAGGNKLSSIVHAYVLLVLDLQKVLNAAMRPARDFIVESASCKHVYNGHFLLYIVSTLSYVSVSLSTALRQ